VKTLFKVFENGKPDLSKKKNKQKKKTSTFGLFGVLDMLKKIGQKKNTKKKKNH